MFKTVLPILRFRGVARRLLSIPSTKKINVDDLQALGKINPVVRQAIESANVSLPENAKMLKRIIKENERLQLFREDAFADGFAEGEARGKLVILRRLKTTSKMSENDLRELCKAEGIQFEDL